MATAQASTDPQLGFPTKGSLKRFPFPRLMREIARGRLTGSLYLLSGQTKKVVFFEHGKPVFVRSNVLSECLGQILSSEGLITQEQCEQTLEAIRRTGKKQGELLVEMGILSEGNLRYGLEAQLRTKLFDIFAWEDGRFQYKTDPANLQLGVRLELTAEGVIIGAIVDQYSEDRATRALSAYEEQYPVVRAEAIDRIGELNLLPEEAYFVRCLDGSRTVMHLLADDHDPAPPTPAALLFGLLQAGVVQLSEKAMPAKPRPAPPDLAPRGGTDDDLAPEFEPQDVVTEYEDTPLPGELPKVRGLLGDHEADFEEVESEEAPAPTTGPQARVEVSEELVAAEPEAEEETFDDDQIELLDDEVEIVEAPEELAEPDLTLSSRELETVVEGHDGETEGIYLGDEAEEPPMLDEVDPDLGDDLAAAVDDDLTLDPEDLGLTDDDADLLLDGGGSQPAIGDDLASLDPEPAAAGGNDLLSFDELDDIDLGDEAPAGSPDAGAAEDPEMVGAMRFNEAETAMSAGDFPRAVTLLEDAYDNGFDVAELHAMLAYARFVAAGQDAETAQHAFELLDYAQNMDPSLDLVHAYRGAIYSALDDPKRARESLDRALELNPYCEFAMEVMDQLG